MDLVVFLVIVAAIVGGVVWAKKNSERRALEKKRPSWSR